MSDFTNVMVHNFLGKRIDVGGRVIEPSKSTYVPLNNNAKHILIQVDGKAYRDVLLGTIDRPHLYEPALTPITFTPEPQTINVRPKCLYVGQIFTRKELRRDDNPPRVVYFQGMPSLHIHNLSHIPLTLKTLDNATLCIPAKGSVNYKGGRDQRGVSLGTVFEDIDGLYPEFELLNPATDLYYGSVSTKIVPEYDFSPIMYL
jgi:hypothetical protein